MPLVLTGWRTGRAHEARTAAGAEVHGDEGKWDRWPRKEERLADGVSQLTGFLCGAQSADPQGDPWARCPHPTASLRAGVGEMAFSHFVQFSSPLRVRDVSKCIYRTTFHNLQETH